MPDCRDCPEFWSSSELRQSVEEGAAQLLALDPPFWSKELLRWLEDRHSSRGDGDRLHSLLCCCLEAGPWRQHCQRLLQLLPQEDLLPFAIDLLGGSSFPAAAAAGSTSERAAAAAAAPGLPGAWLVFRSARWPTQDALLLAVALGCCLPQLLRLLRDDELAAERQRVQQLVQRLLGVPTAPAQQQAAAATATAAAHWCLRRQLQQSLRSSAAELELLELLLLHLFASAFLVQQLASSSGSGGGDAQQLQQLLTASGLPCQLAAPTASLSPGGHSRRRSHSSKRQDKKRRSKGSSKKKKKKRRRRSGGGASSSSEGSEGGGSSGDESDGGGSGPLLSPLLGDMGAAAAGEGVEQQQLWQLQGSTVSSTELLHAVIAATASAHARWLFGSLR